MSDEETRPKRLHIHVPEDGGNEIQIDDLDTEISDSSIPSDSEMNDSDDDIENSEESEMNTSDDNIENSEESEIYGSEDSSLDDSDESDGSMDEDSESETSTELLDRCLTTSEDRILDELIDNLFSGRSIGDNLKTFPTMCLLANQKSIEFTEEMLQEIILDKTAVLLKKEFEPSLIDFERARAKNQYWKKQFKMLKQELAVMKEELDELPIMPPPYNKIHQVRNVGTQINSIQLAFSDLRSIPITENKK